ncbi:MAG: hypothetical protein WEF51_00815 [Chloroflexota bacterium]
MVATAAAVVIIGSVAVVGASAIGNRSHASEHWGVITRNTIGSPVAELRSGPYGSFGVTGSAARPPFGKGSLGIYVANNSTTLTPPSEKVDFGNEVDFYGDPLLALSQVGFHVFQTGENASAAYGGPTNMPNIRFEIDPNGAVNPSNFTTMVWVPGPAPMVNQWSGYIDATTNGSWYFTGTTGVSTGCNQATMCTFAQAKASLDDVAPEPTFYTVMVGKGRDNIWVGAVDGLRINSRVFDFEANGVRVRGGGGGDD